MATGLRIAIDGPAGAGKSTVAKILARRLGYVYVDTGAMYRALTLMALQADIDINDGGAVEDWLAGLRFDLELEYGPQGLSVTVNGLDVTESIRTQSVNNAVTVMAAHKSVREFLLLEQKRFASRPGVVMDGRDIGTVIMPEAELKFFLVASLEERAKRRQAELEAKGEVVDLDEIKASIARRDAIDSSRESAPLTRASDAVLIDTTGLTIPEVVDSMVSRIEQVGGEDRHVLQSGKKPT